MALLSKMIEWLLILVRIIGWLVEWAYRKLNRKRRNYSIIESSTNHIENVANDLRSNKTAPLTTTIIGNSSRMSLNKELIEQKKLAKNVYVRGISKDLHINNPEEIFLKICKKLEVVIHRSDIQKIHQKQSGIVVTLHNLDKKKWIISQTVNRYIWCYDLFELGPKKEPWKIFLQNHMTSSLYKIWKCANRLTKENRLHSFELTDRGIVVKRTPSDNGHVILCEKQLLDYTHRLYIV